MVINRFILKAWAVPFFGSLLAVTGVLLLSRALKVLGILAEKSVIDWSIMASLLLAVVPYFLMLTVPIAFFFACMRLFLQLQQNSELDALRASGVSYLQIMKPVIWASLMVMVALLITSFEWMPRGQMTFQSLLFAVQKSKPAPGFEPQRFNTDLEGFTIYIDGQDEQGTMHGMMLEDHRSDVEVIYLAETAQITRGTNTLQLTLHHGTRLEGSNGFLRSLAFDEYIVSMNIDALGLMNVDNWRNRVFEMPTGELFTAIKAGRDDARIELHWRLIIVVGLFTLLLFVLPLSLTPKRSGSSGAYLFGVALILAMYNMQVTLHQQVASGQIHLIWMWVGQTLFSAVGAWLSWRANQDRLLIGSFWFGGIFDKLRRLLFLRPSSS